MPSSPPSIKRAICFIDGQNLFYAVKKAFGYSYPNYDILALAKWVCSVQAWQFQEVRFYTGMPDPSDSWHPFWAAKKAAMGRQGIHVCTRPLRYRNQTIKLSDGSEQSTQIREEKGIDVRIAIDMIRLAHHKMYDVAVLFSQDQDLAEAAKEICTIAHEQDRWIKVASAFPHSSVSINKRGVNDTDWIKIDRTSYERCIDRTDYRASSASPTE